MLAGAAVRGWSRVWRAEIDWSPHAYEGTATVMVIVDSEDCE